MVEEVARRRYLSFLMTFILCSANRLPIDLLEQ